MISRRLLPVLACCLCAATPALAQSSVDTVLKEVQEIQDHLEKKRGLNFQAPVKVGVKKPAELKEFLREQFDEEAPAEEMSKQEQVYKLLGLIPQDFDTRAELLRLMQDRIGGFYSPIEKELFLIDRNFGGGAEDPNKKMNDQMVMAHELHHALQDQNFSIDRWLEVLGDHEDRVQGYKSLVEGEAQIIGLGYLFGKMGRGDVDIRQINRMQAMMMKMSPEGQEMAKLPAYLTENMMFPYTQGAEFVQALQRKDGWEGVTKAFHDPPTSTEQILHPEKYYAPRDEPQEIRLPSGLKRLLGGHDVEALLENTFGEFSITLLLRALGVSSSEAAQAAAGWDGDRYVGYRTAAGETVVVWLSTWDSEAEATEFHTTYAAALSEGHPNAALELRGTEVLLVDGVTDAALRTSLVAKGFQSIKTDLNFNPLPGLLAKPAASEFTHEAATSATLDLVGHDATMVVPPGFTAGTDPVAELKGTFAFFTDGSAQLRVGSVSAPLATAAKALGVRLGGPLQGKLVSQTAKVLREHKTEVLVFVGEKTKTVVILFEAGERSLVATMTIPEGYDKTRANDAFDLVLETLEAKSTKSKKRLF